METWFAAVVMAVLCCFTTNCYFFGIPNDLRNHGRVGHWGAPDAEINWCEQDFMLSDWVAEPVNVATNLVFIALPTAFLVMHRRTSTEIRVLAFNCVLIGLGSMLYHASLRYYMMLLDELPIFWYGLACVVMILRRLHGIDVKFIALAHGVCITLAILTTAQSSHFHQVMRGVMTCSFAAALVVLAWGTTALVKRMQLELGGKRRHVPVFMERANGAMFAVFVISVMCWIADNYFCWTLQHLPLGLPYPHLHACWHVLVAPVLHFVLLVFHVDDLRASEHLCVDFRWGMPIILE